MARIRSGRDCRKLDDPLAEKIEAAAEEAAGQSPRPRRRGAEQHRAEGDRREARLP